MMSVVFRKISHMLEIQGNNPLVKLTYRFSLEIISLAELLDQERKYVISRQLLKSGTSIGANAWEAQHAESLADFIHKLKISAKEAEETTYWLLLCKNAANYQKDCDSLLDSCSEIRRLLAKIIITSKQKLKNNYKK